MHWYDEETNNVYTIMLAIIPEDGNALSEEEIANMFEVLDSINFEIVG